LPDQHNEGHITRATAQLPGLQIEIAHRQSPTGDAEQISISLLSLYRSQGPARLSPSNAQCEHLDEGDPNHEHGECYGIVVEPMLSLCEHDTPPYSRSLVALAGEVVQIRRRRREIDRSCGDALPTLAVAELFRDPRPEVWE